MRGSRNGIPTSLLAAIWLAECASAQAQSLPNEISRDAARILEQQHEQTRARAEDFDQQIQRPPSGQEPGGEVTRAAAGAGCVAIRRARLVGVTRYSDGTFRDVLTALAGDCVSINAVNDALHAITNRYIRDGYVTSRAFVRPQDLKEGVLTLTVIEGRVGNIEPVADHGTPPATSRGPAELAQVSAVRRGYGAGEIAGAFPIESGEVLNLRALEQGVDQLARMAKADPSIDIAPGETPGASTVLVKRKPTAGWLRPAASFNNDGSAATGRLQATATLDVDSLLGLADVWSFYFSRNVGPDSRRGNRAFGGFASLPRGWWALTLSGGVSDYHSVLSGNGLSFVSRGRSWNASAALDRMLHRDAKSKLSASVGLALLDTRNFIQGIALRTGTYRIVTGTVAAHWQRRLGTSLLTMNGAYARGLGILDAQTVVTASGGATGRFDLLSGDLGVQSHFAVGPTRLFNTALVRWQWGFDNLFPAQRFSLGGTSTVRGFRDDGISGRTGASLREQLACGIVDLAKGKAALETSLSGFVGFDIGAIRPDGRNVYERGVIQSGSFGIKAQARQFQAEVALALPLTAPSWVLHKRAELFANVRVLL